MEFDNTKFLDKTFPKVDISDKSKYSPIYKYDKYTFIYDKKDNLLLNIYKDEEELEELGKDTPWRELDSVGLNYENWKDKEARDEYLSMYTQDLSDEAYYLMDEFKENCNNCLENDIIIEDIEIHDTLNADLWENDELKPEIKEKIIEIVDEFKNSIKDYIDLNILDIELVGSNASYNYNDKSDIDVHIVTNFDDYGNPEEIVNALMNALKTNFNKTYDIDIHNRKVEIYVENVNSATKSNGIYSVLNDKWIKKPEKENVNIEIDLEPLLSETNKKIDDALKSDDITKISNTIDDLYIMRRDSLMSDGEYGIGNLVFKEVRNNGLLDGLKNKKITLASKELSLENISEKVEIEVENEGILEVPKDKQVMDLPLSHFKKLIDKNGREKIIRAITNLEVWNKNDDKEISKWAKDLKKKLGDYGKDIKENVIVEEPEYTNIDDYNYANDTSYSPKDANFIYGITVESTMTGIMMLFLSTNKEKLKQAYSNVTRAINNEDYDLLDAIENAKKDGIISLDSEMNDFEILNTKNQKSDEMYIINNNDRKFYKIKLIATYVDRF